MAAKKSFKLTVTAPPISINVDSSLSQPRSSVRFFTPVPMTIKKSLFYTPLPDYKFDREIQMPDIDDLFETDEKTQGSHDEIMKKLKKCEALHRVTLVLKRYQKWIRQMRGISQADDSDSDSDSDDDSDEDSDDSSDDNMNEEMMDIALYQQLCYGNDSMIKKVLNKTHTKIHHFVNKELGKNYSENRLLEDYLHLINEHKSEFFQIHHWICDALDCEVKPDDECQEIYYTFNAKSSFDLSINVEKLLDEIHRHFGGIFDSSFFKQKYRILNKIGTGMEGDVYKIALKSDFGGFTTESDGTAKTENFNGKNDDLNDGGGGGNAFYAAKMIPFNEVTMNNYRTMSKLQIIDNYEIYLNKKENELILISELWDCDLCDFLNANDGKCFRESELFYMFSEYIIPLLQKLHLNHYIHGDIKPSNIVMRSANGECEYGLIDFGTMMKMNVSSETVTTSIVGSLGYHCPELAFEMYDGPIRVDTKIDVFPLALTMLYLMTKTHPLLSEDLNILGKRKIQIKIDKFLKNLYSRNRISSDLSDLISKMLCIDPLKRLDLYAISKHKWITKNEIETKKILFLDVDGVINTSECKPRTMKVDLIMKLKRIVNLTQCNIVLSSSWRRVQDLKRKFMKKMKKVARLNIDSIYIGDTPFNGQNPTRAHEIQEYLHKNELENECNWCVVDDMDLVNENESFKTECGKIVNAHFVRTDPKCGLTDINVTQIVTILNA